MHPVVEIAFLSPCSKLFKRRNTFQKNPLLFYVVFFSHDSRFYKANLKGIQAVVTELHQFFIRVLPRLDCTRHLRSGHVSTHCGQLGLIIISCIYHFLYAQPTPVDICHLTKFLLPFIYPFMIWSTTSFFLPFSLLLMSLCSPLSYALICLLCALFPLCVLCFVIIIMIIIETNFPSLCGLLCTFPAQDRGQFPHIFSGNYSFCLRANHYL